MKTLPPPNPLLIQEGGQTRFNDGSLLAKEGQQTCAGKSPLLAKEGVGGGRPFHRIGGQEPPAEIPGRK